MNRDEASEKRKSLKDCTIWNREESKGNSR
jgi:hypothetical protein